MTDLPKIKPGLKINRYLIIAAVLLFTGSQTAAEVVRLQLQWYPQAQFAGYIMAVEKGIYREKGLTVELLFAEGSGSSLQKVSEGDAEFCTAWLSQALTLTGEKALVNICQVLQKSSLLLVAKAGRGIYQPEDLNGRRIGLWSGDFSIQPAAFFRKFNLNYEHIEQSYNIYGFLDDAWDVASVMYYNEYYRIIQSGIDENELVHFFFADYDLNFPEDGIYCRLDYLQNNTQTCRDFVAASLEGWQYAELHPEETVDVIIQYAAEYHLQTNYNHQQWMLKRILESVRFGTGVEAAGLGRLKEEDYYRVARELQLQGLLPEYPAFREFYQDTINVD
ncbi:MAG: ABC transporter substrate-binding protein [Candidatus Cloacimonetes bacterium]|nr:ABC transporter substrate-binding protein [Candidatus Cloacimonadota bacterium]